MPTKKGFLAFSCPHAPHIDKMAAQWMLNRIADHRPDVVVCLGDLFEADSATRWPSEADWTLAQEFVAGNRLLREVREAAGGAKLVLIEGNHDANLLAIGRVDKKLRGLTDYRRYDDGRFVNVPELAHWDIGTRYIYHRSRGVYRLGQVAFSHGFDTTKRPIDVQAVRLSDPYGLFVHGHTHRPTSVTRVMLTPTCPLPYSHANAGTLRDMDSAEYMDRKGGRFLWGQAVVIGEALVTKSPRMSRNWDAETLVYKMYDGEMVN